ncbi:MAG: DegT/DnrJ/EryC1/StrS family aminotransferase [Candidatus Wallbacteria bacterium]|nr:DegT/DnrJ/EryC1/StrS family aminotransferase [Candidatus Wallbacteria bacterium]
MTQIPLSSPDITQHEIDAVTQVLRSQTLSLGPKLPEFEQRLAKVAGRRYCVAVNSGTSALHLAVRAMGIGTGDRVVTTPFSFIASANCILMEGATPVFVDVDPEDYNIDVDAVACAIEDGEKRGEPIRAVLGVDVFGRPADWPALESLARRHSLRLIEDSCEAIGATLGGRPAGNFGELGAFAFYPNKQMTTGEGGALVTDDEELVHLAQSMRNQGRDDGMGWLAHGRLGFNYRLSDIQCALGLAQLDRLPGFLAKRSAVAAMYATHLGDLDEIHLPLPLEGGELSWFVYVVRLADRFGQSDRDRLIQGLRDRGIGSNAYFPSIHLQPFYAKSFGFDRGSFPICESISDRTFALPFHNNLSEEDVRTVASALKQLLRSR